MRLARRAGDLRLLTITGPGGSQVTALYRRARSAPAALTDGVFWVPLGSAQAPSWCSSRPRRRSRPPRGWRSTWGAALLLLLDNFEHVLEAAGGVDELLAHARGCSC